MAMRGLETDQKNELLGSLCMTVLSDPDLIDHLP